MNRSALRQLGPCWPDVLALARFLAGPGPTVHGVFAAALTATAIPHAWPTDPVPRMLSVLYKSSLGMSQITAGLLLADDGVADAPFASLGDDAAFFRFLDDGRWLVGRDQACAGPEALIRELFRAVAMSPEPARRPPVLDGLDVDGLRSVAVDVAGRQALALLGTTECLAHGVRGGLEGSIADGWLAGSCPAWMRTVLATPGRRPEHVRRLFPEGACPPALERLLREPPATPGEWLTVTRP